MQNPRLSDQLCAVCRVRHYSPRIEKVYIYWIKRFIFFHDKRHPKATGVGDQCFSPLARDIIERGGGQIESSFECVGHFLCGDVWCLQKTACELGR